MVTFSLPPSIVQLQSSLHFHSMTLENGIKILISVLHIKSWYAGKVGMKLLIHCKGMITSLQKYTHTCFGRCVFILCLLSSP